MATIKGGDIHLTLGPKEHEIIVWALKNTISDLGGVGYGGPCPPPGTSHRYVFTLYALDATLRLKTHATKAHVTEAVRGHVLAEAHLTGRYGR
ncbi:hypothetical protein [Candidatus Nitrospira bockiana]